MFRAIDLDVNADNLYGTYKSQSGCCPAEDFTECKYRFTIPDASTVSGITLLNSDGTSVVKTLTTNLSIGTVGAKAVVKALKVLIESAGYVNDDDAVPAYRITDSGTNTLVDYFGEAVIASIQRTSGGDLTPTVTCTRFSHCDFFLEWEGAAAGVFTVNGTPATLASLTPAGNTAANVVSALEGAANWPTTADVVVVETATAFEITITGLSGDRFDIDGANFSRSNCKPDYS